MDRTTMPGDASRLSRIAIAVSFLVALGGCAGGVGGSGVSTTELEAPTAAEVEETLTSLSTRTKPPELFGFGGTVAVCLAIGCPVADAVHVDHVPRGHEQIDFSGFDFIERRRTVSLATKSQRSGMGDRLISRRTLGGWMEHGFFLLETTRAGRHAVFSYRTYSRGNANPADPVVSVRGTWSGVMAGVVASFSDDDGAFVEGDATVTVAHPGGSGEPLVDVEFTSITREDTGAQVQNMTWENLPLEGGGFGAGNALHNHGEGYFPRGGHLPPLGPGIFGQFHGPNHEEVGGLFHRDGLSGAFGASRDD